MDNVKQFIKKTVVRFILHCYFGTLSAACARGISDIKKRTSEWENLTSSRVAGREWAGQDLKREI